MKRRWIALALCLLLLTGCMDVESYLQPPRAQGQQQAVQNALEIALSEDGETAAAYVLKYPVGGSISSSFLMLDENGLLTDADTAVMAVAFYAAKAGGHTHIHFLLRDAEGWHSVKDVKGESTDLHKVSLGDLDGDGKMELLVGWNLYSSSYQLSVYLLDGTLKKTADVGRYSDYFVGDMDADGTDEFLLLHIDTTVTASLRRWTSAGVTVMGDVVLPGGIRSFEKMLLGKLSSGDDGLYVDALLESGEYTTTLLYWDGKHLHAPLHQGAAPRIANRTPYVAVMDIDGNGVPEIPVTSPISGGERGLVLADWYSWDLSADAAVRQFSSVVNVNDGYCIELEDAWTVGLSATYDEEKRALWLQRPDENDELQSFLIVQNTVAEELAEEQRRFEVLPGNLPLRIWYETEPPYSLTMEKISYMLVAL